MEMNELLNRVSLELKLMNQKKELDILNKKNRELANKIYAIEKIDYLKNKLSKINPDISFKRIIADEKYKDEIERLFKKPQAECIDIYSKLLEERNKVVHRYTKKSWNNKYRTLKSFIKHKTLTELVESSY